MSFRSYNQLKSFNAVARLGSLTRAATELNLSKGALSYQIARLEEDLGFKVFERSPTGIHLTEKGTSLWHVSQTALHQIDREIETLREQPLVRQITIGVLTYFYSRWLSPRLLGFMEQNPSVAVRIEPVNNATELHDANVDIGILWGDGHWDGWGRQEVLRCPARPAASPGVARKVEEIGIEIAVAKLPLLTDSSGNEGWKNWHATAGLQYAPGRNDLIIRDSNIRVQAVIDGQGLALWDDLVAPEIANGRLTFVSDIALDEHGYWLLYRQESPDRSTVKAFIDWILSEATSSGGCMPASASANL